MTTGIVISEELSASISTGVEICYQTFGDPQDEPLLLIMGLGGPMNWWDSALCTRLAETGFYVVRFDNRDIGRSSRTEGRVGLAQLARAFLTGSGPTPYRLSDMAADTLGLMDHLGLAAAHVAGVSMGGMIAQTIAVQNTERVLSLTSIMSTTGRRSVGRPQPSLLPMLAAPRRPGYDNYLESVTRVSKAIGSPGFPSTPEALADRARTTWERGISPEGTHRQMLAVLTQQDRTDALGRLPIPVLVVHGMADRLVNISGGRATAAAARNAELLLIKGMGHDLPTALHPTFTAAIRRNADRAR